MQGADMDDGGRRWNIRVGRPEGVHATGQLRPFLWPASWLSHPTWTTCSIGVCTSSKPCVRSV